jgi:hypothetical protein
LYYIKLKEIDNEIKLENEINEEADDKVKDFNNKLEEIEKAIKIEVEKVTPVREKNIENLSKIQRLNLELKGLDEENERIKEEIDSIKNGLKVIEEDIDREKSIVIDANSNEKRLKEEKNQLIEIDSKYYETEKLSNQDLDEAKSKLKSEQERMDSLLESLNLGFLQKNIEIISSINLQLDKAKSLISENKGQEAISALEECRTSLSFINMKIKEIESKDLISNLSSKNELIKQMQDGYAETYSKNQNIKKESVKRNERIKVIDKEIESLENLVK